MGNNVGNRQILDKHKKLTDKQVGNRQILDKHKKLTAKQVVNYYPDVDLLFFNIPITSIHDRSYFEQISKFSDDELSNTKYNELYLHKHKIIITSDDVITNILVMFPNYAQSYCHADNTKMYKHFDFIQDVEDTEPNELVESLNAIINYENEIKLLEKKIKQEKQKILNLDYIKSKLNMRIPYIKEYIETIKFIKKNKNWI